MARLFPDDIPYLEETDKRKKKLFYTENPLELIADLLKIFEKYLDSIQIYNKVVQGTPISHHRVLFFIERISKKTLCQVAHVLQTPTQTLLS